MPLRIDVLHLSIGDSFDDLSVGPGMSEGTFHPYAWQQQPVYSFALILPVPKSHVSFSFFSFSNFAGEVTEKWQNLRWWRRRIKLTPGASFEFYLGINRNGCYLPELQQTSQAITYHFLDYSQEFIKQNCFLSKRSLRGSYLSV